MKEITTQNWGRFIGGLRSAMKTIREKVQAGLLFGFTHYADHGDTKYLTDMVNLANELKTVNARKLQRYVEAHTNLVWTQTKLDNDTVVEQFKKSKKKVDAGIAAFTTPTMSWFEFEKHDSVPVAFDPDKVVDSAIAQIRKKIADKDAKFKGTRTHAKKVLAELENLREAI